MKNNETSAGDRGTAKAQASDQAPGTGSLRPSTHSTTPETETMDNRPNNLNELMNQAATALETRDTEWLEKLMAVSEDWLQDDESREAQSNLLAAMLDAAYDLED